MGSPINASLLVAEEVRLVGIISYRPLSAQIGAAFVFLHQPEVVDDVR